MKDWQATPPARRQPPGVYLEEESGHTLLEATVALALLITVLVPLRTFVVYLSTQRHNADQVTALAIGRRYVEETLHARQYTTETFEEEDARWRIRRDITVSGLQVTLRVRVYRHTDSAPYVDLCTVRLL